MKLDEFTQVIIFKQSWTRKIMYHLQLYSDLRVMGRKNVQLLSREWKSEKVKLILNPVYAPNNAVYLNVARRNTRYCKMNSEQIS